MRAPILLLLPLLLLASCGTLPEPFIGRPGAMGARLAQPPPARLAVPTPAGALLGNAAGKALAGAVADALVNREVPAIAQPARPGDWQLDVTAELHADRVVPKYIIRDETGRVQGSTTGVPLPAPAWADGDPLALKMEAVSVAPKIAELLEVIDAMRKRSDPNSIYNRPVRVAVPDVAGAPGDGDSALALEMRRALPHLGDIVQDAAAGADFVIAGKVRTAPAGPGMTRVEIRWGITDAAHHDLGQVVQLNDVPAGTLSHFWGDVASVVAQQAAGGVQEIIQKQRGQPGALPKSAGGTAVVPAGAVSRAAAPSGAPPASAGAGALRSQAPARD